MSLVAGIDALGRIADVEARPSLQPGSLLQDCSRSNTHSSSTAAGIDCLIRHHNVAFFQRCADEPRTMKKSESPSAATLLVKLSKASFRSGSEPRGYIHCVKVRVVLLTGRGSVSASSAVAKHGVSLQ